MGNPTRTRKRELVFKTAPTGAEELRAGGTWYPPTYYPTRIVGQQITTDEYTGWPLYQAALAADKRERQEGSALYSPDGSRRLRGWDVGGEFISSRNTYEQRVATLGPRMFLGSTFGEMYYSGCLYPTSPTVPSSSSYWPAPASNVSEQQRLMAAGATAISKTVPTTPVSSVANFLGELKEDGLPSFRSATLMRDRVGFFKNLGSDYLAVEFGWKPFLSDLRKFWLAARDSHKILGQYERDSGKLIRRRYRFPTERSAVVTSLGMSTPLPVFDTRMYSVSQGPHVLTTEKSVDMWFSGAYTYYLARGNSHYAKMQRYAQEADKLLGLRVTPEVLWELEPWSWLVDWISNFGDVISNVTRFSHDGLVMHHGYIMAEYRQVDHRAVSGIILKNGTVLPTLTQSFGTTTKIRRKASPYGFGLDTGTFTSRQWAILAALGMTKAPRAVR